MNAGRAIIRGMPPLLNLRFKCRSEALKFRVLRPVSSDRFHYNISKCYSNDSKYGDGQENKTDIKSLLEEAQLPVSEKEKLEEDFPEFPSDFEQMSNNIRRDQTKGSFREEKNPQEYSVLLFPGQGSQFVGMGRNLLPIPKVQEIFERANQVLGYDLLDLCLNGPKEKLDRTDFCQPAIYVVSLAAVEKLKEESESAIANCTTAAGFSVGEFAALSFSGAMTFEEGLDIVHKRGRAMQRASEEIPSGMMTAFLAPDNKAKMAAHTAKLYCTRELGMDPDVVECTIANYLFPECKVYSGNVEALQFIEKYKKDFGIRRVKNLPVSGAFHSKLMQSATKPLAEALGRANLSLPIISVHSNVDSKPYKNLQTMKKMLIKQVTQPVKWEQTMHAVFQRKRDSHFPRTYEVGPGKQLGDILKINNNKAHMEYRSINV